MSTKIIINKNQSIDAQFGFGKVLEKGRIDTPLLISSYKDHLKKMRIYFSESFNHDKISINEDAINFNEISAKNIVFAEEFGLNRNPFFKDLSLNGTKGGLLIIEAPELKIDFVLKSSIFLIPLRGDRIHCWSHI